MTIAKFVAIGKTPTGDAPTIPWGAKLNGTATGGASGTIAAPLAPMAVDAIGADPIAPIAAYIV
jgi:hypothetical protein